MKDESLHFPSINSVLESTAAEIYYKVKYHLLPKKTFAPFFHPSLMSMQVHFLIDKVVVFHYLSEGQV